MHDYRQGSGFKLSHHKKKKHAKTSHFFFFRILRYESKALVIGEPKRNYHSFLSDNLLAQLLKARAPSLDGHSVSVGFFFNIIF